MKVFIEEYGMICVVVLVVLILIALAYFFREPLQGYFKQVMDSFFSKATDVASIKDYLPPML